MTSRDIEKMKKFMLATGLGVAFSLTGASYAQAADGDEPIGLFDENAENMEGQDVEVDSLGQIDITVKDLEIAKVLQLLSIQSQRNIVASRNVSGKVSADLYGVSFNEALEAILTPNGYGYEEKGNFIYVYTAAELEERQNAMRKTVTKMVRLNYISATEAASFVTPLLSTNGNITASGEVDAGILPSQSDAGENTFAHADTLLIRDYEENVEEIEAVLAELDVRPKQVLVEATILQATLTEANAFG
ncbi:MAG: secretin N-terminal domain-containing protein, partial [Pseudomonadota bacterium]